MTAYQLQQMHAFFAHTRLSQAAREYCIFPVYKALNRKLPLTPTLLQPHLH